MNVQKEKETTFHLAVLCVHTKILSSPGFIRVDTVTWQQQILLCGNNKNQSVFLK